MRGDIVAIVERSCPTPPLRVRLHDGSELVVAARLQLPVASELARGRRSDTLGAGSHVGVIAAPAADGTLRSAIAVLVYPADYAAAAKATQPWDLRRAAR